MLYKEFISAGDDRYCNRFRYPHDNSRESQVIPLLRDLHGDLQRERISPGCGKIDVKMTMRAIRSSRGRRLRLHRPVSALPGNPGLYIGAFLYFIAAMRPARSRRNAYKACRSPSSASPSCIACSPYCWPFRSLRDLGI